LNGTIDLRVAITYSALARTVAQSVNAEIRKAQLERKSIVNTDFGGDET